MGGGGGGWRGHRNCFLPVGGCPGSPSVSTPRWNPFCQGLSPCRARPAAAPPRSASREGGVEPPAAAANLRSEVRRCGEDDAAQGQPMVSRGARCLGDRSPSFRFPCSPAPFNTLPLHPVNLRDSFSGSPSGPSVPHPPGAPSCLPPGGTCAAGDGFTAPRYPGCKVQTP